MSSGIPPGGALQVVDDDDGMPPPGFVDALPPRVDALPPCVDEDTVMATEEAGSQDAEWAERFAGQRRKLEEQTATLMALIDRQKALTGACTRAACPPGDREPVLTVSTGLTRPPQACTL